MADFSPRKTKGVLVEHPPEDLDRLIGCLAEEMVQRWRKGERPRIEEYLALHPQLCDQPGVALELLYEEIHLRQEHGQEINEAELFGASHSGGNRCRCSSNVITCWRPGYPARFSRLPAKRSGSSTCWPSWAAGHIVGFTWPPSLPLPTGPSS